MGEVTSLALAVVIVALLSYASIGRLRRWAEHASLLEIPNARSSHDRPVPRGGGLAIAILTPVFAAALWAYLRPWPFHDLLVVVTGMAFVAATGWRDDRRSVSRRARTLTHTVNR